MKKLFLIIALIAFSFPLISNAAPIESEFESCSVNFNFSPSTVELGDDYSASWFSDGIESGTMQYKCSDMADWISLPDLFDFSTTYTSDAIGSKTCTLRGRAINGRSCSSSDSITVVAPSCSASISWNKTSVPYGGSAIETWQVSGADRVTGDCGTGEIDINPGPQSSTFSNLTSNTTCTIKGYDNGVLACSSSATINVEPPPPSPIPLKITVNAPSGLSWKVVGPQTYTGAGNQELLGVPAGTYTLYVTNGWNGRVVTSISPAQQQNLEAPPVTIPGTTNPPPPPPPPPPPTLTPGNPVQPDPERPRPEVQPFDRMFFKSSPFKFLSNLFKSVNATEGSITFTVSTRGAQVNKGSLSVTPNELGVNQTYQVVGTTNDSANAYKFINLFKTFTRKSNGETGTTSAPAWNSIITNEDGNFVRNSSFACTGGDSSVFLDSDYTDVSYIIYDQGDGTGDRSPTVSMTKLCGHFFGISSKDENGNPVQFPWTLSGVYGNWSNSDSKVSYANGNYSMRLDRGLNSVSIQNPGGYGSFKAELYYYVSGRGGGRQLLGTYYSSPIPFNLDREGYRLQVTWYAGLVGGPPSGGNVVCSPKTQEVNIGQEVTLYGEEGEGAGTYSWIAPGGSPSSAKVDVFKTVFNSAGTKTVSITSGRSSSNCSVNVIEDVTTKTPLPTVDIRINGNDSWIMNPGESATLSWTSTNADACIASGGSSGWSGSRNVSGSWSTGNLNIPPNSYNYSIRCFNDAGDAIDSAALMIISGPTLNVGLSALPSSGRSPLNSSLTATVSGSASGNINYYFWWNCSSNSDTKAGVMADGCGDPSNPLFGQIVSGTNENPKSVSHAYSGVPGTTFVPKVVVERGAAASAEAKTNIVISTSGEETHLTCINNSCVSVSGAGANTCSPQGSVCDSGPGEQTHLGCINNSCVRISGAGEDQCSAVGAFCSVEPPVDPETACIFTSNPKAINRGGSSRLEWDCDPSVNSCSISPGIGSVSRNGTRNVSPAQTTRYTLTCDTGPQNTSWTTTVNVFQIDEDVPQ